MWNYVTWKKQYTSAGKNKIYFKGINSDEVD
jgi:hypothetical protein